MVNGAGSTITSPASAVTQAIQVAPAGAGAVSAYSTATRVSTVTSVGHTVKTTFTSTLYTTLTLAAAAAQTGGEGAACAGGMMTGGTTGASRVMSGGVCAPTANNTMGNVAAASAVPSASAFTGGAAGLLVKGFGGVVAVVGAVLGVVVLL